MDLATLFLERLNALCREGGTEQAVEGGGRVVWLDLELLPVLQGCYMDIYIEKHRGDTDIAPAATWALPEAQLREALEDDANFALDTAGGLSPFDLFTTSQPIQFSWDVDSDSPSDWINILDLGSGTWFAYLDGNPDFYRETSLVAALDPGGQSKVFTAFVLGMMHSYAGYVPPFAVFPDHLYNSAPEFISRESLETAYRDSSLTWEDNSEYARRLREGTDPLSLFDEYFPRAYSESGPPEHETRGSGGPPDGPLG